jgi:hypothetical protein
MLTWRQIHGSTNLFRKYPKFQAFLIRQENEGYSYGLNIDYAYVQGSSHTKMLVSVSSRPFMKIVFADGLEGGKFYFCIFQFRKF